MPIDTPTADGRRVDVEPLPDGVQQALHQRRGRGKLATKRLDDRKTSTKENRMHTEHPACGQDLHGKFRGGHPFSGWPLRRIAISDRRRKQQKRGIM